MSDAEAARTLTLTNEESEELRTAIGLVGSSRAFAIAQQIKDGPCTITLTAADVEVVRNALDARRAELTDDDGNPTAESDDDGADSLELVTQRRSLELGTELNRRLG